MSCRNNIEPDYQDDEREPDPLIHPDHDQNPLATAEAGVITAITIGVLLGLVVYVCVSRLWL